jgi:hypothetical protein
MSQDELRHWIRRFLYDPAVGWSHCKLAFARFLGIDLHGLKSKIRQRRIHARFCGGEQIRFSRQIRGLLAGERIPTQMRTQVTRRRPCEIRGSPSLRAVSPGNGTMAGVTADLDAALRIVAMLTTATRSYGPAGFSAAKGVSLTVFESLDVQACNVRLM